MNTKVYSTSVFQERVKVAADKEAELLRLIQVKAEKICNGHLVEADCTQLSYLTKEEQAGALALPKELILDKLLHYLRSL